MYRAQSEYIAGEYKAVCPVCEKPIISGYDLHESILTRKDVQGNKKLLQYIMVEDNCVAVHRECHPTGKKSEANKKCILSLVERVGFDSIRAWLLAMDKLMKSKKAIEELNRVKMLIEEKRGEE